ncbi:MAG TPA: hypothetical protein PKV16_08470 [Caldisericia bacterium]|nr:hypothetical protein [Caldisericia bacterium]HPF49364.1 hypothetical protein [Caldisericia bacterium]HPI84440.1 hypothetical protein [Caldisericia bacterium]HPQ93799.1 hypothetical protein [Caldisericia bacterium]HRV75637.1 hypothetical protein [Caldisericia bacterium]
MYFKIDFRGKKITWRPDTVMKGVLYEGKSAIAFHSKNQTRHEYIKFPSEKVRDSELKRVEKILSDKGITREGIDNISA